MASTPVAWTIRGSNNRERRCTEQIWTPKAYGERCRRRNRIVSQGSAQRAVLRHRLGGRVIRARRRNPSLDESGGPPENCNRTGARGEWHRCPLSVHDVQTSLSAIPSTSSGCHATAVSQGVVN